MATEENWARNMFITMDKRGVKMEIAGEALFKSGQTELQGGAQRVFRRLIPIMTNMTHPIIVEGHTDDSPTKTRRFPSNWELSSARASSVARFLIKMGNLNSKRFTVVGCAETKPLFENTSAENKAKNRRVTIIFEMS